MSALKIQTIPYAKAQWPWQDGLSRLEFFDTQKGLHFLEPDYLPDELPLRGFSFRLVLDYILTDDYHSTQDQAGRERSGEEDKLAHNQIVRDWLTAAPLARARRWKNLFRQYYPTPADNLALHERLFGKEGEGDTEENGRGAALKFRYATFASDDTRPLETELKLTNPHDERRGAGTNPVTWEVVKAGAICRQTVDFFPFPGCDPDQAKQIAQHLATAAEALTEDNLGQKGSSSMGRLSLLTLKGMWGDGFSSQPPVADIRTENPA